MATTTRSARTTRSTRRAAPPGDQDLSKLGSFPPPMVFKEPVRTVSRDGTAVLSHDSEQLAVDNLALASHQARKFALATQMTGMLADLEAVAWTGLLNACRRYDPDRINPANGRPYALSSAAVPFIDGAMRRFLRDKGHAIKFPNEWKEKAPRARREVLSGKRTIEEAAAIVGMDPLDVAEMLHCMGPTSEIREEQFQHDAEELDAPDDDAGATRLSAELRLTRYALGKLDTDTILLMEWWSTPRRRGHPQGPLQQFWRRADRGRRSMPADVPIVQMAMFPEPPGATKDPAQMARILSQRAEMLGVLPLAGKLSQELIMADGAGANRSSNRRR